MRHRSWESGGEGGTGKGKMMEGRIINPDYAIGREFSQEEPGD
jgi:hypothetical protein